MAEKSTKSAKKAKTAGKLKSPAANLPKIDYARLARTLSRIVGPDNVHKGDAVCMSYASYMGAPKVVIIPRNLKEMRLVLDACRDARAPLDTVWSKQVEKDVLLVDGVVVDTRMIFRSYPSSVFWDYTHYGEPPISYRQWRVR
jgi:hypothetical protein